MMTRLLNFFNEVKFEMEKVSWPSWDELKSSTYIVLYLSLILIIFLFFVDLLLTRILSFIL
ncbi:MAG: preprotein translocase subunit SecE [Candidatus Marinimicrobia bacterium]|nr:preprotein translocase subunit SecE [Candidatus Neomarinimicrobiota bacterium]